MLYTYATRFNVTENLENFLNFSVNGHIYIGSQFRSYEGIHDRVHVNQVQATAVVDGPLEYANLVSSEKI